MAYEVVNGATGVKLVVQEAPNINRFSNQVDINTNKAIVVTEDLFVDQIDQIFFPV